MSTQGIFANEAAARGQNYDDAEPLDEAALAGLLNELKSAYNGAVMRRRHAAEKMRDERRDFQKGHKEAFEAIEAMRKSAIETLKTKLRASPTYVEAEADKSKAAKQARQALKDAKEHGVDVTAMKIALKMADMDAVERRDFFDAIDIYAKCLRLWGPDY